MKTDTALRLTLLPLMALSLCLVLAGCDSTSGDRTAPINIGGGGGIVNPPGGGGTTGGTTTGGTTTGGTTTGGGPVTPGNALPVALPDVAVVQIGSTGNPVNVLANDSDANGDALTITAVNLVLSVPTASGGTNAVAADGKSLRYTPPAGFIGTQTLRYTIDDGKGGVTSALAVITVSPLAVPPVAVPDVFTKLVDAPVTSLDVLANDVDGAGGGLVVSAASSVATLPPSGNGTVSVVDGALRYQPATGFTGVETLSYTLTDTNGATATAVAVITVLPLAAPPVALPDVATLPVGGSSDLDVLANDVDLAGGGLTITDVSALTSLPVGSEGSFSVVGNRVRYVPSSSTFVGTQTAQYTVTDQNGSTGVGLITLVVTPALPSIPPVGVPDVATRSSGVTDISLNVLDNDIDVAGGGLTVTASSVVLGLPDSSGVTVTTDGTVLNLALPSTYAGVLTLSYTITDANGATATTAVLLTVAPVALPAVPPVALPDVSVLAAGAVGTIDVLANDIDVAGGGLTLTAAEVLLSLPTAGHGIALVGNQLQFTPAADFAGVITVTYTVTDANGTTGTGLVTITVTPTLLTVPPVALPDLAIVATGATATLDVLANDVDAAGGGLTLTAAEVLLSLPTATHTVGLVGNQLQFTPATAFAGVVTLNYTVTDANGGTATGVVSITVTPELSGIPPVALPDVAVVAPTTVSLIDVLANDVDVAGGGLTLTAAEVLLSLPTASHGLAVVGNELQFTPASGFAGVVTVSYTLIDTNGGVGTGLVTITVTPALLTVPPVALPDLAIVATGATATLDVLANDVDAAGGGLTLTAAEVLLSLPTATHAVAIVGNELQVTPAAAFAGVITVTYTVTDANGSTGTGLVTITVAPALPIALPAAVGDVGSLLVTLLSGTGNFNVLANDIDPAGGGFTLQSVSLQNPLLAPIGTLLSVVGNQVQLTVPLLGLVAGVLPIEYTAVDSLGRTITGVLNVTLGL